MKTRTLFFLMFILLAGSCKKKDNNPKPQLTQVIGTVTDKNGVLEGVSISYVYRDGTTGSSKTTDSKGNYRIENLKSGFCTFTFMKEGYEKYDQEIEIFIDAQPAPLNVIMKELSGTLQVSQELVEFNNLENEKTIYLENTQKQGSLEVSISINGNEAKSWLKIDKQSGTITNATKLPLTISVNRTGIGYGVFNASILINQVSGSGSSKTIQVILNYPNPSSPSVSLITPGSISQTTATFTGTLIDEGGSKVTERGHVWAESDNPTLVSNLGITKHGSGSKGSFFISKLENLTPGKTYYIKSYATNAAGTSYSSPVEKFTTSIDVSKPTVGLNGISEVTNNSATVAGIVTSDGGKTVTEMGVIYGVSPTPSSTDKKVAEPVKIGSEFKVIVNGLESGITYYASVFATNEKGTEYSPRVSFTTGKITSSNNFSTLPFSSMVLIKGGTFEMGDSRGEGNSIEKPVHSVTVSDFYMAQYEITQKHWKEIMGDNLSSNQNCDDCPVEQVNAVEIQAFLTELNKRTGKKYRLPTEAEWEYAAGGGSGTRTRFGNGKNIADPKEMNFSPLVKQVYSVDGENRKKTIKVGSFAPNALGLYDMSGNVAEWCSDFYGVYGNFSQTNPTGPTSGTYKMVRGGSWDSGANQSRITYRESTITTTRDKAVGFRIVLTP